jgi:hypothetical protein
VVEGQAVAQRLLERLGIAPSQHVAGAYLDLLAPSLASSGGIASAR